MRYIWIIQDFNGRVHGAYNTKEHAIESIHLTYYHTYSEVRMLDEKPGEWTILKAGEDEFYTVYRMKLHFTPDNL